MFAFHTWARISISGSALSVVVIAAMRTRRANPFNECVSGQCNVAGNGLTRQVEAPPPQRITQGVFQELHNLLGFVVKSAWRVPCVMVGIHNIVDWSIRPGGVFHQPHRRKRINVLTARVVF